MTTSDASDVCLSETDAVAYVQALVDDEARARVEAHIDGCADCRWLVSELARGHATATASHTFDTTVGSRGGRDDGTLSPGQRVGRYVVGDRLGSGGMGVVYAGYDPQLDRKVALKVLRPGAHDDDLGRARLLAEARAMARLSHPGVVPIYDVGAVGPAVVLAIELVDGLDAQQWLARTRPSWRTAVAVLAQAGRGLAAAHAAGLVHRDIKPANILVGHDGRARVTDFGLARAVVRDAPDARVDDAAGGGRATSPLDRTRTGAIVGTPAYMASEQHRGGPADARSDQFSFCVVLYEAVYRERPFAVPELFTMAALAAEVTAGRVRAPPKGSRVPPWLRHILLRGLAVAPEARWPSVEAMLDALVETPRRRRRRWVSAGGAATGLAVVTVFALGRPTDRRHVELCPSAAAELARVWEPVGEAAALQRIAGLGAYGQTLAPRLAQQLDDYQARWVAGQRDACLAHRRGSQSDDTLDRRMVCLERGRAGLTGVAELVRGADEDQLAGTILAVRSLPDPAACADVIALRASVAPPPPALKERADAIVAIVERGLVELAAGDNDDARRDGVAAVAAARALGYRPLLARALLLEGRATMDFESRVRAGPALAEAVRIGVEVGDDELAVEAWARGAWVNGTGTPGSDRALDGLEIIEALAARSRAVSFARALLNNNVGSVELARGRREAARLRFERAIDEARGVTGPGRIELVNARGNVAMTYEPRRRDALLGEAAADLAALLGSDHPQALRMRIRRAMWTSQLADVRDLLGAACASYQRFRHVRGAAIECWVELGYVAEELGDRAGAVAAMQHAGALSPTPGEESAEAAGYLALWQGDADAASERFRRAIVAMAPTPDDQWWNTFDRATLRVGLGRARRGAGDPRGAREALAQAIAELEQARRVQPAPFIDRRLARARAELAWALAATGAGAPQIAEVAREAAILLGEVGGRSDEIATLDRLGQR